MRQRQPKTHEPLEPHRRRALGSDRSFGLVFAAIFTLISLWPALHGRAPRLWALAAAVALALAAVIRPALLHPFNRLWFKLGRALHVVVEPVVMGLLFVGAVVPVAWLMRLRGKDQLQLKRTDEVSYWIVRDPPGPSPGTMKKQF